jgi:ketosteroid isomerase-like protein
VESADEGPERRADVAESVSLAFLALLERLSPEQRAAFLLRDVFDYPYDQIARIVGTSEANARQLAARARRHVDEGRPRFQASPERRDELAQGFFEALERGDLRALEDLLAEDVVLHGDGGGKVPALARAVGGRERVARTMRAWLRAMARFGISLRRVDVNGDPGAVLLDAEGVVVGVWALEIAGDRVRAVRSVVNPDKLTHLRAG